MCSKDENLMHEKRRRDKKNEYKRKQTIGHTKELVGNKLSGIHAEKMHEGSEFRIGTREEVRL